jgi:hypothetical protein
MKKNLLIIIHLVFMAIALTCWLWCDWRAVAVLAIVHLAVLEIMHGCPLSHVQFSGNKDAYFFEWWMPKLGIKLTKKSRRAMFVFLRYILPFILIGLAILLQVVLNFRPLVALPF